MIDKKVQIQYYTWFFINQYQSPTKKPRTRSWVHENNPKGDRNCSD